MQISGPTLGYRSTPAMPPVAPRNELAAAGLLHPDCERIFRIKENEDDPGRDPIVFHRHQSDAIETALEGKSYVLTTGTGSGKSLGYIVPIVNRLLRDRQTAERGQGHCGLSHERSRQ